MTDMEKSRLREGIRRLVGEKHDKYIGVVKGIGFQIDALIFQGEDGNHVKKFLSAHKKALLRVYQRDIEEYVESDDILPEGARIVCNVTGCGGWGAYISNIISEETGIPVGYWTQNDEWDFTFDYNPDVIMIDDETFRDRGFNWAIDVLEPYARELGIKIIRVQYFQSVFEKDLGIYKFLREEDV